MPKALPERLETHAAKIKREQNIHGRHDKRRRLAKLKSRRLRIHAEMIAEAAEREEEAIEKKKEQRKRDQNRTAAKRKDLTSRREGYEGVLGSGGAQ